jgi:hypothetical protein
MEAVEAPNPLFDCRTGPECIRRTQSGSPP